MCVCRTSHAFFLTLFMYNLFKQRLIADCIHRAPSTEHWTKLHTQLQDTSFARSRGWQQQRVITMPLAVKYPYVRTVSGNCR
jgi:hypothetical protein